MLAAIRCPVRQARLHAPWPFETNQHMFHPRDLAAACFFLGLVHIKQLPIFIRKHLIRLTIKSSKYLRMSWINDDITSITSYSLPSPLFPPTNRQPNSRHPSTRNTEHAPHLSIRQQKEQAKQSKAINKRTGGQGKPGRTKTLHSAGHDIVREPTVHIEQFSSLSARYHRVAPFRQVVHIIHLSMVWYWLIRYKLRFTPYSMTFHNTKHQVESD